LDDYAELRYPNLNNPVEVGSDDLPKIDALGNALFKRMPKSLHAVVGGLQWSIKGGRILMDNPFAP
jgi:hypothetical protein